MSTRNALILAIAFIVGLTIGGDRAAVGSPVDPDTAKAPASMVVMAGIDTGLVVYYGYELQKPYYFGTDGSGRLFLSCPNDTTLKHAGLTWLPWLLAPTGTNRKATATIGEPDVDHPVSPLDSLAASARRLSGTGEDGRMRAERKVKVYGDSDLIDSSRVAFDGFRWQVAVFPKKGLPYQDVEDPAPADTLTSDQRFFQTLDHVLLHLRLGRMVIIDYGVELSVHPKIIGTVKDELATLRTRTSRTMQPMVRDSVLIERFSKPLKALRDIVEGR